MPHLRRDPVTGTWVIISPERQKRPLFLQRINGTDTITPTDCPFCPGNEAMTPLELLAVRRNGGSANGPGWDLRVVPNKYPALRVEGEISRSGEGIYDRMTGVGAHEVFIDTPDHGKTVLDLSNEEWEQLFLAAQSRFLDLKKDIRLQTILFFKNSGAAAGATLAHSHSQLLAMPVTPPRLAAKLAGALTHHQQKQRCIYCDILQFEKREKNRVLIENSAYIAFAPYASRFPFELTVFPQAHRESFEHGTAAEIHLLADTMHSLLQRIGKALGPVDLHFILHNAPFQAEPFPHFHWHIECWPVLGRIGGFEWGSGVAINPISPEEAIQALEK